MPSANNVRHAGHSQRFRSVALSLPKGNTSRTIGHPLSLRVTDEGIRVSASPGRQPPIRLRCRDETAVLNPGEAVEFPRSSRG